MKELIILTLLCVAICEAKIFTRFKAIKCYVYDPSGVAFNYCYVKAYSRKSAVLNVGITFLRPINDHFYVNSRRKLWKPTDFIMFPGTNNCQLPVWNNISNSDQRQHYWMVRGRWKAGVRHYRQVFGWTDKRICSTVVPFLSLCGENLFQSNKF